MEAKFGTVSITAVVLFLGAWGSTSQSLIVSQWHAEGPVKIAMEFSKDGASRFTMLGQTQKGVYKFTGPHDMEWNLRGAAVNYKVYVTATDLDLTGRDGQSLVFRGN